MSTVAPAGRLYRGAEMFPVEHPWPHGRTWAWTCPRCAIRYDATYQSFLRRLATDHTRREHAL